MKKKQKKQQQQQQQHNSQKANKPTNQPATVSTGQSHGGPQPDHPC